MSIPVQKQKGVLPDSFSFVKSDSNNIVIDTIKKAEKSDDIIVRLYEAHNCNGEISLVFDLPVKKVYLCDLLENEIGQLTLTENSVKVDVSNYEIITLKLKI